MSAEKYTLAARYFFKNCAVSIYSPGKIWIDYDLSPKPDDIVLNRSFYPAQYPNSFIGDQSDFYRFLDASSMSNASMIKKLSAIGYMLCNKLPRGGGRCRAFICVNDDDTVCFGKSLFAEAVSLYCDTVEMGGLSVNEDFFLSEVNEDTQLLIVDDIPADENFYRYLGLCTHDWHICRKCQEPIVIPISKAPYLLITANRRASSIGPTGSFRRRFVILEFSPFFGPENPIDKYIGRRMFDEWGQEQWHMFDNLMFYCVLEYLSSLSRGEDIFSIYR